ncbi:ATP-binding protein [Streptomyces sp. NPDC087917]|uniref:ATP-binding protein n=1 Tax=unclassified Streptomyces TaxID=2593676 RepID=UPI00342BB35D
MDTVSVDATAACSTGMVAEARATARDYLATLRPAVDPDAADPVALVVSELVTNALRHGGGAYTLRLTAHPDSIEVAVDDPSPRTSRMRAPDLVNGTGGFGWHMVNDLAHTTVITPKPDGGKTVRALLPR